MSQMHSFGRVRAVETWNRHPGDSTLEAHSLPSLNPAELLGAHKQWRSERAFTGPQPCGGAGKRIADIAIAGTALVLLAPLMLLLAALIKLSTGGSVLYAHQRVGFAGRRFYCLKFRSMVEDSDAVLEHHLSTNAAARAEWKAMQKLRHDPRICRVGHFLRSTSLDELPQLFNVLQGTMSCVGPRPVTPAELSRYGARASAYLRARPGMTGLWQVSGRSRLSYRRRVALDSVYVTRWSWPLDLTIIARTIPALLLRDGAS